MTDKEIILGEIERRKKGLWDRINTLSHRDFCRLELINRAEALEDLYWWITQHVS